MTGSPAAPRRPVRRGLSPRALEQVRDALAPGGRIRRYRPLHGGVSSSVHLVRLEMADGQRQDVVVRRYGADWHTDPAACLREFRLLHILAAHGFPAPRPLLLEPTGGPFGVPTVVMTRVPGRPQLAPHAMDDYLRQLAGTLARLHALPLDGLDFLPHQRDLANRSLATPYAGKDPLQRSVWQHARGAWPAVAAAPAGEALLHGDYWPGNVLWARGRLTAVVDWEQPRLGDPTKDVATCRGDLTVLFGPDVADTFVACYEAAAGRRVANLPFWDVFVCTWALAEVDDWLPGWQALGRAELSLEQARERLSSFARAALAHLA